MQSVHINTNVVSSNPAHARCTRYNIMFIKFVTDLRQVGGFLRVLRFPLPIKLTEYNHDLTEILMKLAVNTINLTLYFGLRS